VDRIVENALKKDAQALAQANMEKAMQLCNMLFSLVPPGCTIEYIVPKPKVDLVGVNQEYGKLIVTKPGMNVVVQAQRKDG